MKHLHCLFISIVLVLTSATAYSKTNWQQVYKDKDVTVLVDQSSYFDETGKVMLWAKNITKDKIIYVRYQMQCKPHKLFRILAINAQDKKTNKMLPIQLGDGVNELHQPPKKSPAEFIVNSVCGKK